MRRWFKHKIKVLLYQNSRTCICFFFFGVSFYHFPLCLAFIISLFSFLHLVRCFLYASCVLELRLLLLWIFWVVIKKIVLFTYHWESSQHTHTTHSPFSSNIRFLGKLKFIMVSGRCLKFKSYLYTIPHI